MPLPARRGERLQTMRWIRGSSRNSPAPGHGPPPTNAPENVNLDTVLAARRLCTQLAAELTTSP